MDQTEINLDSISQLMTLPQANILLVDDHPENLLALEAMLEDLGHNLVRANSGEEALKWLLKMDFAVILLDVMMPGMDGFETATLVRERPRSATTPIIFLTAIGKTMEHVFQGYSVGAVDYIVKPLVPEILRAKVIIFVELFQKNTQIQLQAKHIVTANAELEQQLREVKRLNRELEAVNRELESFSYSVSHDLRGPLRRINGYSQALLEDYLDQLDEPGQQFLERIMVMCEQMGKLIDDLLKLSRVTRVKIERGPVNLSMIAEQIAEECGSSEPDRNVKFMIAPNIIADGDERLLHVLLENLLGNAWKFTQNHPTATIEFGVTTGENDEKTYFVRDDGAGFNMDFASHLFGAFQRLHTDSEFEGTGIGLATAQRIVHRHGGKIWAQAAVEQGATFFFTL